MKIIMSSPIVQGIFIAVAAGAIMFFVKYLVQVICPIRKSKVFSSFKYDEQMLEDGTYVLEENKEYKEFFRGTVAHCIYRNISSHNIAVKKALVVIDKIASRSYKRVDIICHYADDLMHFYIINNGNIDCYDLNVKFFSKGCAENDLKELLGEKFCENYNITELKSGEILKLGSWKPNKDCFIRKYMEDNWLIFGGDVYSEGEVMLSELYLGTLFISGDEFEYSFCQGGTADVESGAILLKNMEKEPQKFEFNLQYSLAANSDKHLQIAIYPKESCYIKYHFEIYTDTLVKLRRSNMGQAHIDVPIYDTEGGFFFKLRNWLMENKTEHYYLNDNRTLQKQVLSFPPKSS